MNGKYCTSYGSHTVGAWILTIAFRFALSARLTRSPDLKTRTTDSQMLHTCCVCAVCRPTLFLLVSRLGPAATSEAATVSILGEMWLLI